MTMRSARSALRERDDENACALGERLPREGTSTRYRAIRIAAVTAASALARDVVEERRRRVCAA